MADEMVEEATKENGMLVANSVAKNQFKDQEINSKAVIPLDPDSDGKVIFDDGSATRNSENQGETVISQRRKKSGREI